MPIYLVRRLHQICAGQLAEALDGRLTMLQWVVLTHVQFAPDLDQSRLAEVASIDRTSTGRTIDELEALGLVERRLKDGDRRVRILRATRKGKALRQSLVGAATALQERLLAPLGAGERETLFGLLRRLIEANAAYAKPGLDRRKPRSPPIAKPKR